MRIQRLLTMSLGEVAERGRQGASKWLDRLAGDRSGALTAIVRGPAPTEAEVGLAAARFRENAAARFFAGAQARETADLLAARLPGAHRDIIARANAICARRVDLLGYEHVAIDERPDWHRDFVLGRRAPLLHWSRLDPLDAETVGDSKVIWELNRHQWVVTLAQAYWLTDDARYAEEAADVLDDWAEANPYGMGINWASSLEAAYRVIAWCWTMVLLRDTAAFSERELPRFIRGVATHAAHVERYLSYYFSPNTHLTGEALGLFYAGVLFQELPAAARWRSIGLDILVAESRRQIHPDGLHFEQATCYHRYTVDIYLHLLILAERNGLQVPAELRDRVERLLEAMLVLQAPDGSLPEIGDADGGRLLPLARRHPADQRDAFAVGAALFRRSDFAWAARGLAPEVLWLCGAPGVDRLAALPAKPPDLGLAQYLPDGGYIVLRTGWEADAHQLIFDVGPLGCPISGAHGHADLLSVQCAAFGERYLVDAGTYCYTPQPAWRTHFRSSGAHSTVMVDQQSQAVPVGPFHWRSRPSATLRQWTTAERFDLADAEHVGYDRLSDPVRHRRRVMFVRPHGWVIVDDLYGHDEHRLDVRFQFAPVSVRLGPDGWVAAHGRRGDGLWLGTFSNVVLSSAVRCGEDDPIEGWISDRYGVRQPAPVVIYSVRAGLPRRLVTIIAPALQLTRVPEVEWRRSEAGELIGVSVAAWQASVRFDERAAAIVPGAGPLPD